MDKYLLCIDQGTTGTKILLLDKRGEIHASSYRKHTQYYPKSGWVEHDAEEIWEGIVEGVDEVMRKGEVAADGIESIGMANQGETVLFWQADNGRPLHRSIVWSCRRSQAISERWEREDGWARKVADKTGLRIDPYFSATKIRWMMEEAPLVQEQLACGQARCCTLDAWLIWKMTGGAAYATDPSTAARTLLYNIRTGDWDREILDYLGIEREWLPTVLPTAGLFGVTRPDKFCGIAAPIRASMVDQPAALYGHLCTEPGSSKCTYGTGCFVYMNTGDEISRPPGGELLTTIVWEIGRPATYALDGAVYGAGSAINWGMESLQLYDSLQQLQAWSQAWYREAGADDSAEAGEKRKDRVWFVPSLSGIAAPYWRSDPRGLFLGLSHGTSKAEMARAMLEGIAHRVADVLEEMRRASGHPPIVLKADGGLAENPYLMQVQADLLGIPVEVSREPETTARGVGYLTGQACGWWDPAQLKRKQQEGTIYRPRLSPEDRRQWRSEWKRLVRMLLEFYE